MKRIFSQKAKDESIIEYHIFMAAQIHAIDKSKYIESQKAHRDLYYNDRGEPSDDFYIWWIKTHGPKFREAWEKSVCKNCFDVRYCKECLKDTCHNFVFNPGVLPGFSKNIKLLVYRVIFMIDMFFHPEHYKKARR